MKAPRFNADELRIIIRRHGFNVSLLAAEVGLNVRTLERRFNEQLRLTPKAWITHERLALGASLLVGGQSNKQVAASLSYTCESNFCRDFKRYYGCAPQEFVRACKCGSSPILSHFDKQIVLPRRTIRG